MKYIQFKKVSMTVEINGVDVEATLDYKDELMKLCTGPKDANSGTDYAEMEVILPIRAKVREATGELELEDAEHIEIALRAGAGKFNFNNEELFAMLKHFKEGCEKKCEKPK